jgi:Tol biopolymer transport system component
VQYFERRRMEHHTENRGTPFEVLLGLLGKEVLNYEGGVALDTSGQIAFTSSRTGNKEIWIMEGSGSNPRQVTANPGIDDFQPAWSPDGTQITYVVGTEATRNQDIWVINTDGTGARKLSESSAAEWEPAWSPDGTRIAFVSDRAGDADIFIRNADGSGEDYNLTAYAPDSAQYSPAWSPDGTRIAYISTENGRPSLWVMTVDGSERNELHSGGTPNYPNWTPDSARIIFDRGFGLGLINSDGQNYQSLYDLDGTHPTISPDGATIAYEGEENDIIIADIGGEETRNLTDSPGSVDQDPDWR